MQHPNPHQSNGTGSASPRPDSAERLYTLRDLQLAALTRHDPYARTPANHANSDASGAGEHPGHMYALPHQQPCPERSQQSSYGPQLSNCGTMQEGHGHSSQYGSNTQCTQAVATTQGQYSYSQQAARMVGTPTQGQNSYTQQAAHMVGTPTQSRTDVAQHALHQGQAGAQRPYSYAQPATNSTLPAAVMQRPYSYTQLSATANTTKPPDAQAPRSPHQVPSSSGVGHVSVSGAQETAQLMGASGYDYTEFLFSSGVVSSLR